MIYNEAKKSLTIESEGREFRHTDTEFPEEAFFAFGLRGEGQQVRILHN